MSRGYEYYKRRAAEGRKSKIIKAHSFTSQKRAILLRKRGRRLPSPEEVERAYGGSVGVSGKKEEIQKRTVTAEKLQGVRGETRTTPRKSSAFPRGTTPLNQEVRIQLSPRETATIRNIRVDKQGFLYAPVEDEGIQALGKKAKEFQDLQDKVRVRQIQEAVKKRKEQINELKRTGEYHQATAALYAEDTMKEAKKYGWKDPRKYRNILEAGGLRIQGEFKSFKTNPVSHTARLGKGFVKTTGSVGLAAIDTATLGRVLPESVRAGAYGTIRDVAVDVTKRGGWGNLLLYGATFKAGEVVVRGAVSATSYGINYLRTSKGVVARSTGLPKTQTTLTKFVIKPSYSVKTTRVTPFIEIKKGGKTYRSFVIEKTAGGKTTRTVTPLAPAKTPPSAQTIGFYPKTSTFNIRIARASILSNKKGQSSLLPLAKLKPPKNSRSPARTTKPSAVAVKTVSSTTPASSVLASTSFLAGVSFFAGLGSTQSFRQIPKSISKTSTSLQPLYKFGTSAKTGTFSLSIPKTSQATSQKRKQKTKQKTLTLAAAATTTAVVGGGTVINNIIKPPGETPKGGYKRGTPPGFGIGGAFFTPPRGTKILPRYTPSFTGLALGFKGVKASKLPLVTGFEVRSV